MRNRDRRKANAARREQAARKHEPLPMQEQHDRAESRRAEHRRLYPHAPTYVTKVGNPELRELGPVGPVLKPVADRLPHWSDSLAVVASLATILARRKKK